MPDPSPDEPGGMLALVLHSHMPYVEGFGTYPFGEEWLFDAVLRSYLPVLEVADRLTMTVTPVLADQLEAPGLAERLNAFGEEFRLGSCLLDAEEQDGEFRAPCMDEAERYRRGLVRVRELGGPLGAFQEAVGEGRVSLMTSSATHAVLPLLATDSARDIQIDAALRSHRRRFGEPDGIWLPECAYVPGLEDLVARHGLSHFCVDHPPTRSRWPPSRPLRPRPGRSHSRSTGRRSHGCGRWTAIRRIPFTRTFTGSPSAARGSGRSAARSAIPRLGPTRAREQAREFLAAISKRLAGHRERTGSEGLVVFAIDTELLGHWWWEGPEWLAEVVASAEGAGVELVTLADALARTEPEERAIHRSSWGEHKDLSTWDAPEVSDLAWGARRLELRLVRELAARNLAPERAERAVRELLALQASDWAFLDKRRQAGDYPFVRVTDHARAMLDAIHSAPAPAPELRNLAPDLSLAPLTAP